MSSLPHLAGDYPLSEGVCRVTVTKVGSHAGHITYHAQAWQLDADGRFQTDDSGYPIRSPGSDHSINLSAIAARTATRDPGWVKVLPAAGEVLGPDALPDGWSIADVLPDAAEPGQRVMVDGQGWEWSIGELERIRLGKREELAQILAERALDALA